MLSRRHDREMADANDQTRREGRQVRHRETGRLGWLRPNAEPRMSRGELKIGVLWQGNPFVCAERVADLEEVA